MRVTLAIAPSRVRLVLPSAGGLGRDRGPFYVCLLGCSPWVRLQPGQVAVLRGFFQWTTIILIVMAPAISMRLFSDEMRNGSLEALMTTPIGDAGLVAGKFLGAVFFLTLMLLPTVVFVGLLFLLASPLPDAGPILAGYASMMLVGVLYISIGTFSSSLTSSQMLSLLGTFLGLLVLLFGPSLALPHVPAWAAGVVTSVDIRLRVDDFGKGVFDFAHVVFFLSASVLFLVLAYLSINSRRWR